MNVRWLAGLLLLWLLPVTGRVRADHPGGLRRFALVVSAQDGGPERARLQYAERDAKAIREVLRELGGVQAPDARSLAQPSAATVVGAFAELQRELDEARREGARTELFFYYSGHSDESALLLGDDRLSYVALRKLVDELPADVRIAILDSCASGAFTRAKGGVHRAAFLLDASTQLQGHAFLTSSSADEAAQESDKIGGSFFTHYFVSGLRGAADASGDRKVTLTEAYRFAFDETLQRTAQTQYGSQHPAYEIRLAGTGDLVMTDLRATSAKLVLDESVAGRLFVWSAERKLVAELDKARGRRVVLAVPPGRYRVESARERLFEAAELTVRSDAPARIDEQAFREVPREATLSRGAAERYAVRPFAASLVPPLSTNPRLRETPILNYVDLAFVYDGPDAVEGLQLGVLGIGARHYARGLQLSPGFALATELRGMQLTGVLSMARTFVRGAQLSGGVSHAGEALRGLQAAGVASHARTVAGAQLALGASLATTRAQGLQVGAVAWARSLDGVQIGALALARDVRGAQIGALNVAAGRVRGLQLGLVNYADEADVSLAALGMTRQGGAHLQLTLSDVVAPELALRLDAKYNYSFVALAVSPYGGEDTRAWLFGAGLGAKLPTAFAPLWVDLDLGFRIVQPLTTFERALPNTLLQLRALPRFSLHKHFSLFAGLTLNALFQRRAEQRRDPGLALEHREVELRADRKWLLYWPGFAAGILL